MAHGSVLFICFHAHEKECVRSLRTTNALNMRRLRCGGQSLAGEMLQRLEIDAHFAQIISFQLFIRKLSSSSFSVQFKDSTYLHTIDH